MNAYDSIKLDGQYYSRDQLLDFCNQIHLDKSSSAWLLDVCGFIIDWLDDTDEIRAQTSGSTGIPKTIFLKKKHMIASAKKTIEFFKLNSSHSALLCLSANYIAGKMMIVRAFVGGFNLILSEPKGNPLSDLQSKVDFAALVPIQVSNSLKEVLSGDKVNKIIIGGGVIPKTLKDKLSNANTVCYETYGMTETVSHVAIRKIGTKLFTAMPGVTLSTDKRGCLVIKAEDIVASKVITNDIVELESDKEFCWLGRYDNIINSGGIKLVPEEIEKKLSLFLNYQFFISSMPDEKLGEQLVLVLDENQSFTIESLIEIFNTLSRFERPRKICIVKQFPFTSNNKISRSELRKCIESLSVIYDVDRRKEN